MNTLRTAIHDTTDWGCDLHGRDLAPRRITRRGFMKNGALALVGTSTIPAFLTRSVLAEATTAAASHKKLVVLFQRGAADGLNIVVPYRDPNYLAMRPSIAIKPDQVLDLDGTFGLHPALAAFKPLYDQGHLAIVHAAGSPDTTRSHFDAQDYMESGTPGIKSTTDGWLNRALQHRTSRGKALRLPRRRPRPTGSAHPSGQAPRHRPQQPQRLLRRRQNSSATPVAQAFQALYDDSTDAVLHGTGQETFEAVRMLKSADPAHYKPASGVTYPNAPFGNSLKQIAQLLKANLGVEAAFADIGGWDTHVNQGAATGQLAIASESSPTPSPPSGRTWATTPKPSPSSP